MHRRADGQGCWNRASAGCGSGAAPQTRLSHTVAELPAAAGGGLAFVAGVLTVASGSELVDFPGFRGIGQAGRPHPVARDLGDVRGLCALGPTVFVTAVTDRGAVVRDQKATAWNWPDQKQIGGCAASEQGLAVGLPDGERVDVLPLAAGGVAGAPQPMAEHRYGRLTGVALVGEKALLGTTTNKDGGSPVATDDRAVILPAPSGSSDART